MLRKEEVLVRISSEKKARKLAKLLEMFGEKIWDSTKDRLEKGNVSDEYPYVHFDGCDWGGISDGNVVKSKTKASLKELRNILAVEHLKAGDVVVVKTSFDKSFVCEFHHFQKESELVCGLDGLGIVGNFIRYATEEEKALLEPKKELEVGKWYWCNLDNEIKTLFCFNGSYGQYTQYGFNADKKWSNQLGCIHGLSFTEATPQEAEHVLIKEAKRRYKVGDVIDQSKIYPHVPNEKTIIDIKKFRFGDINKDSVEVITGLSAETVFKDGKWAEVIQEPKSLEERVKELEQKVKQLESR